MATGTKNPISGEYPLDSAAGAAGAIVSVPPQCVGNKRCPLLVQLAAGGQSAPQMTAWMRPVANKYGFILLVFSGTAAPPPSKVADYEPAYVDAKLQEVLRRFGIDPKRIAVAGRCASGYHAVTYGVQNLNIFSRIISVSGAAAGAQVQGIDPKNKTAEFLIDRGMEEVPDNFMGAQALRRDGHPVTVVLALRQHGHQAEDYDYVGHWLMQSWTIPNPAKRPAPAVVADPLPALTTEALTKMTTFWTDFSKEPDSIRLTARRAHLHEVSVPVGQERAVVWMMDMPTFAATSPAVAADLKRAGLTAKEHDALRVALLSAMVTEKSMGALDTHGTAVGPLDSTSVLAQNIAFLRAHPDESKALTAIGASNTSGLGFLQATPQGTDQLGPLGI